MIPDSIYLLIRGSKYKQVNDSLITNYYCFLTQYFIENSFYVVYSDNGFHSLNSFLILPTSPSTQIHTLFHLSLEYKQVFKNVII